MYVYYGKNKKFKNSLTSRRFFIQCASRATLAQLVEHRFCKPAVISSSLIGGSTQVLAIWNVGFFGKSF